MPALRRISYVPDVSFCINRDHILSIEFKNSKRRIMIDISSDRSRPMLSLYRFITNISPEIILKLFMCMTHKVHPNYMLEAF